ncbi:hypothetical protein COBT_002147 [Conglomerata obtusa]
MTYEKLDCRNFKTINNIMHNFFLNKGNLCNVKMMYHGSEIEKTRSDFTNTFNYYRFMFQNFVYHFTDNQVNKNVDYVYDKKKFKNFCKFADNFDEIKFSDWLLNDDGLFPIKNIIIDNCCKEKNEYFILTKLLHSILICLDKITNTITFSIKTINSDYETIMKKFTEILNNDLDLFKYNKCKIYISKIYKNNGLHKIEINKSVYNEKDNSLKILLIKNYRLKNQYDAIYTLWPNLAFKDITFSLNILINGGFTNLDNKIFSSKKTPDINNLIVNVCNLRSSFKYAFFRTVEFCGDDKIIIKYFGVIIELVLDFYKYRIWMCAIYEYIKQNAIFKCNDQMHDAQISKFFDALKNILMIDFNAGYNYSLVKNLKTQLISVGVSEPKLYRIETTYNFLYKNLEIVLENLLELGCNIKMVDDRQVCVDIEYAAPMIKPYKTNLDVIDEMYMSETWRQLTKFTIKDLKTFCSMNLYSI